MKYTSAQANKRLKKLTDEYVSLREKESRSREFRAAAGENVEAVRPAYDYADTQCRLAELERCIRRIKHAINLFNATHTVGSMILVLAFSLCACGGGKSAGIPGRETRRLMGTYNWQDVECILFDKDNTFEIYISTGGEEYRLVASGSYTVSAETLCMQFEGDSWLSGTAQEYTYSLEDGKLLLKEVGQSTINVFEKVSEKCIPPTASGSDADTEDLSPLRDNIMVQTGTSESVYGGYISFPAAYTSPENVTQEIAEDVYTAFERFLKDNVFPPDDAWRTVAETEWYVVPQDFGVYRANLDIWMPSEEYGTMHYELSGLVTFFNTQGNYSVSDFRIEVDC